MKIVIVSLLCFSSVYGQQWELIAPMPEARTYFEVCALDDGVNVLVAGGNDTNTSTYVYDVIADSWRTAGRLNIPRVGAPMVKLLDGRVFYPSGVSLSPSMTRSCEVYTPSTDSWTVKSNIHQRRSQESVIVLPNGKVLIVGGYDAETATTHATCELYDPVKDTATFTGEMGHWQTAMQLFLDTPRNNVIMLSGYFPLGPNQTMNFLKTTEEYDIATGKWTVVGQPQVPHYTWPQQSIQLPNGDILAPSGYSDAQQSTPLIEIYTPTTRTWSTFGELPGPRFYAATVYLGNDSVLITGGSGESGVMQDCRIINLKTGLITQAATLREARSLHRAIVRRYADPDNANVEITEVLVFGGYGYSGPLASCEKIQFRRSSTPSSVMKSAVPESLSAFVNGAQDRFICIDDIVGDHTIELVNVLGQTVFSKNLSTFDHRVEVSTANFTNGLYIFKATTETGVLSAKVMLSR